MDYELQRRIDRILHRVQDPQSLLPIAELGWVSRVRYMPTFNKIEVEIDINPPRFTCAICGMITATLRDTVQHRLEEEFLKEFPGMNVVVYQVGLDG